MDPVTSAALTTVAKAVLSKVAAEATGPAATEVRKRVLGDPQTKALKRALKRTLEAEASDASLFADGEFLARHAELLAGALTTDPRAATALAGAWSEHAGEGNGRPAADDVRAAERFIERFRHEARAEETLRAVLDSLALDRAADAAVDIRELLQRGRHPELRDRIVDFGEQSKVPEGFTGRQELLAEVAALPTRHPRGYVQIVGEPGVGKSTLAAALVQRLSPAACFFFRRNGVTSPHRSMSHLCAEIIVRRGLERDHLPEGADADAAFLTMLLGEAVQRAGEPVWLVIDALDEADPASGDRNPALLPDSLPEGAYVAVTHRPMNEQLLTRPGTPIERLDVHTDHPGQRADLRSYLEKSRLTDSSMSNRLTPDLMSALIDRSAGNFLYLTYALDEIRAGTEVDVGALPERLEAYYEQSWRSMTAAAPHGDPTWREVYRPVAALLAVAREPVPAYWLAELTERAADEVIDRVLRPWSRFLTRRGRRRDERWGIFHQSFADFLAHELDLAAAHRRIVAFYRPHPERWDADGGYALRHLVAHLCDAGNEDGAFELLRDERWKRAHDRADPSGSGYLEDVSRVWTACGECDRQELAAGLPAARLRQQLWCALATASFHSRSVAIPPDLLLRLVDSGRWTLDQALVAARQRLRSSHIPTLALGALLPRLTEPQIRDVEAIARGHGEERIYPDTWLIVRVAHVSGPEHRDRIAQDLLHRARTLDGRDRVDELLAALHALPSDERRPVIDEALAVARELRTRDSARLLARGPALLAVAPYVDAPEALLEEGLAEFEGENPATHLSWIVGSLDAPATDEAVMRTLRRSLDATEPGPAQSPYLAGRLPARLVDRAARTVLESAATPWHAAQTLDVLLPRASETVVAQVLEAWVDDPSTAADRVRAAVARRLNALGRVDEGVPLARSVSDRTLRARALVAAAGSGEQLFHEAFAAVRELRDPEAQAAALHELAAASRRPDLLLREALATSRRIGSSYAREGLLQTCVPDLPDALLDDALAAARASDEDDAVARAEALLALSRQLGGSAADQTLDRAIASAESIGAANNRRRVADALAEALIAAGREEDALTQVAVVPRGEDDPFVADHDRWRAARLLAYARALSEPVRSRAIEALLDALPDEPVPWRATVLADLALLHEGAEQARLAEEAIGLAAHADEPRDRAQALSGVLPLLHGEALTAAVDELTHLATQHEGHRRLLYDVAWARVPREAQPLIGGLLERVVGALPPEDVAYALANLATELPAWSVDEVVDWMREHTPTEARDATLLIVASELARHAQEEAAVRAIEGVALDDDAAVYLRDLVGYLPEPRRAEIATRVLHAVGPENSYYYWLRDLIPTLAAGVIPRAIEVAHALGDPPELLSGLAVRQAELGDVDSARELIRALEGHHRAETSFELILRQPPLAADETLRGDALRHLIDEPAVRRSDKLAALAPTLAALEPRPAYDTLTTLLAGSARGKRAELVRDIAALAPLLAAVGGPDAVEDAAEAITDVAQSWP